MNTLTDVASNFSDEKIVKKNIADFFPINAKNGKYKLFFPGDYNKKTLPLINAGDSYAMYVVSGLLGVDLNLKVLRRDGECEIKVDDLNCNAILLCDVNAALKTLFEFVELSDPDISEENTTGFPCWFATYNTNTSEYPVSYVINMHDTKGNIMTTLKSESEQTIIDVAIKNDGKIPEKLQQDYAIIARLSKGEFQYVVIAGIHGFGTMVAAHYLNNLIRNNRTEISKKYENVFFSKDDFISVIGGHVDPINLYVESSGLVERRSWVQKNKEWKLVD